MEGTDELREYAHGFNGPWKRNEEMLLAIADRIDAEHARIVHEKVSKAHADGERSAMRQVRSASEDYRHGHDDAMREVEGTHVKLPVDADDEYIHAGDEMEWLNGHKRGRVTAIGVGEREGWVWVLMDGKSVSVGIPASDLRHYHAPTVEDKLWELLHKTSEGSGYHDNSADEIEAIVREYAKMLRLAGEEDA